MCHYPTSRKSTEGDPVGATIDVPIGAVQKALRFCHGQLSCRARLFSTIIECVILWVFSNQCSHIYYRSTDLPSSSTLSWPWTFEPLLSLLFVHDDLWWCKPLFRSGRRHRLSSIRHHCRRFAFLYPKNTESQLPAWWLANSASAGGYPLKHELVWKSVADSETTAYGHRVWSWFYHR